MAIESMRLGEVAELLGGELRHGDPETEINGIAPIDKAQPGHLAFIANKKYLKSLPGSKASAVLINQQGADMCPPDGPALVVVDDPYMAFAKVLTHWTAKPRPVTGVHARAVVDPSATLGADVNVGPNAYVGPGAVLGDRVDVLPGAYVGAQVELGDESWIGPNVSIYDECRIGARCRLHAGAVIGADGFGFAPNLQTGLHVKIPQVGVVVLEDDVEIGANTTIDRAAMGETRIGRGTKIDNLVMIGHNSSVGAGCFLVSQCGLSGSSNIGNFVTVAGQAGIAGHLKVGDGAVIGAQAGVTNDVEPQAKVLGSPAVPGSTAKRYMAVLTHLPELKRRVRRLEKALEKDA
jgi:UDP-3-O-[3-hydroxymyristoyl] glucosamine N-acyltransferase